MILSLVVVPGGPAQAAPALVAPHITEVYSRDTAADVVFLPANQDRNPAAEWSVTVTATPGGRTAVINDRTRTSARVTGLVNGTKYTFTAVETVAGVASPTSPRSEPVVPRVARRPLPPTIDSVLGRDGSLVVHWNPGADRGAPITGYTISAAPSGKRLTVAGNVRTATLTGLTNGAAQTVSVAASNKIGAGKAATKGNAVPKPPYAPGKPQSVSALPAANGVQGSMDVTWHAPVDDGGAPITSYTVTATPGGKSVTLDGAQRQVTLTGLDPQALHTVTVTAANGVGSRLDAAGTAKAKSGYKIGGKTVKLTVNSMNAISRVTHDRVVFNQATPQVKNLKADQIIVAEARQPRPRKGLLRKITEVRTSGEKVVLMTAEAKLHEAVETSSLHIAPKTDWMQGGQARSLVPGVRVDAEPIGGKLDLSVAYKPQVSTSHDSKVQAEAELGFEAALTGEITVTPDWSVNVDTSWFSLSSASVSATATVKASLDGRFAAMFSGSLEPEKPLVVYDFSCYTIWIGWFPLVLCPRFTLSGKLTAEGSLEFTFAASYEQVVGGSISYSADTGKWTQQSLTTPAVTSFEPRLEAKAQVKVEVPIELSILLYNLAGPGLYVTPSLGFDADSSRTPWGKVVLGVDVGLAFHVPLLSLDESLSVFKRDWTVWESSGTLTTLKLEPTTSKVKPGATVQLTAAPVGCANNQPTTWSLGPNALGSISAGGLYTAPATGAAHDKVIATKAATGTCSLATGHAYVHSGVVAPSAPRNLTFRRDGANVVLSWLPPVDNGYEAVTYRVVVCKSADSDDSCTLQEATAATNFTIVSAADSTDMPVRAAVMAHNSAGDGPPAEYVKLG
ncbi:fibronectin type III domain-containing protein [Saccharothrix isguenensis]